MTDDTDVHTEHCCLRHGCKYNDPECTVTTKKGRQSYLCETCDFEAEAAVADERALRERVMEVLKEIDAILPEGLTRASGISLNASFTGEATQWRIFLEVVKNDRGFTPQIPVKGTPEEALKALLAWAQEVSVTKEDLDLRVSLGMAHLNSQDLVRKSLFAHVFREVQFKVNSHDVALNLYVNRDGTFKVAGSSAIPTHEYEIYTDAFARSKAFVRASGLKPQPAPEAIAPNSRQRQPAKG